MNKLVSVIIPVYNVEQYLCRCVDSIINQTYTKLEIILVDDGSLDNSSSICDKYAAQDKRVRVIHKQNGGQSSARNVALDCLTGEMIMCVDSDDYIHPQMISSLLRLKEKYQADMVQCNFIRGKEDSFPPINESGKIYVHDNESIFYSNQQNVIVCGKLYKAELWDGIRMPLGKVNEDDAVSWRIYDRAKQIVITSTPYYYYYQNDNSTMAQQHKQLRLDFVDFYLERIEYYRKAENVLLTRLSQWRFCLPLMKGYVFGNVDEKGLSILLENYRQNVGDALRCKKVPLTHKVFLVLFGCSPKLCRYIGRCIRK